jgi:hypothetical protein
MRSCDQRNDTEIPRRVAASAGEWMRFCHSPALAATIPNEHVAGSVSEHPCGLTVWLN